MTTKITQTTAYQSLKEPLKQRFLLRKENRLKIEHGLEICKNRGYEYYAKNYAVQAIVMQVVAEIYLNDFYENTKAQISDLIC